MSSAAVLSNNINNTMLNSSISGGSKQYLTVNQVLQRSRLNDPAHVKKMNVSGSALEDISVMDQFPSVEVCSFAVNDISDLEAFRNCSRLQELYLRKNRIADFAQLLHLSHLPLRSIGLAENPISGHPNYRFFVISALPQLRKLDDAEVTPSERHEAERTIPDPYAVAAEMGVASVPPIAGRPSSTAVQGNMLSTSPPSANRHHHQPQQQQVSSPYDSFAQSANSKSATLSMMRQPRFDQDEDSLHRNHQQLLSASSSPSLNNMMMNNNNGSGNAKPPNNRYNGDDVPIGGGGVGVVGGGGSSVRKTQQSQQQQQQERPSTSTTASALAQKRAQMAKKDHSSGGSSMMNNNNNNNNKHDFYTQEIKVAVPAAAGGPNPFGKNSMMNATSSTSRPTTPSAIENTAPTAGMPNKNGIIASRAHHQHHHHQQQHHQDPLTYSQRSQGNSDNNFNESAAIQAVKVLLGSMSFDGITEVKRFLNTM